MHLPLPLLAVLLSLGTRAARGSSDPGLPFMEYLDQEDLVCLKWGFDDLQGNITFQLVVNTTGWVGFGFSPNGGMQGSDMVMGGLNSSGTYFADYHATGKTMPLVDQQQSYTLLSLNENDGQTTMTFQRAIQSCDEQDFHITAQAIKLIYAYGLTDKISYHGVRRGTKEVNLLNHRPRSSHSHLKFLNATVHNITVPASHTYYHCKVMKLPALDTKHHVYMFEPVIEHADLVHHMLLYRCPSFVTQVYDKPCYMGDVGDACYSVVAGWGLGGGLFQLPENVGIPVGGDDSHTHYRLEIHYNNVKMETGRTDSSGLRLYYRPVQPGQLDVGILTTGLVPLGHLDYSIPPKAPQFHTYGVCNTSLFSQLLNPLPDLHVFAVLLHTHLTGSQVRVGHYRGGKQIDFLGLNDNYKFELQEIVSLGNIKTIKEGDEIAVECTYNTSSRTSVTKMGLASTDEMCLAFLLYYPEIPIGSCISHPNTTHPSVDASYKASEGSSMPDQDDIAAYEGLLKSIPQIQVVSTDNHKFASYQNGTVRNMMKTPAVTCQNTSASVALRVSWIVNAVGIILFLFQVAGM
ncbi:DBH-like monooxygenase protein 2 homolog [Nelusetta ayraudi]|uniref:DBH-like monooxygenase protein 2 homolog n=1 Tax=Nelusetta ayraudi TaxID=303726 RepID=UPI003F7105F8